MKRVRSSGCLAAALLLLGGCERGERVRVGPLRTDPVAVDLDQSEMVRARLKMPAGKMDIQGGAEKLMEGSFSYNLLSWKPKVTYVSSSFRGILTVDQSGRRGVFGDVRNDWNLNFNDSKPLDLSLEFGAGEGVLDLGSLNLRGLSIEIGAGKISLDLRGTPKSSYDARIEGGVGEAVIHVPDTVGVSAEARGGIGQIEVDGLRRDGDHYVNNLWESSKVRLRLSVQGGIGHIHIISG